MTFFLISKRGSSKFLPLLWRIGDAPIHVFDIYLFNIIFYDVLSMRFGR